MVQIAHLGEMLNGLRFWDDVQTLATIGPLNPKEHSTTGARYAGQSMSA